MTSRIVNILKTKLVAAELRSVGVTDQSKVIAVAARTRVDETTGALVCLDADGNVGLGSGPDFHLTVADVARELGVAVTPPTQRSSVASTVQGNPFRPGPDFSLTGQMVLMKSDPVLAEDLAAEAGVSLSRNN